MPYANNNGIRIHYEVEGNGTPLVLQHGLTSSLEGWHDFGYTEALSNDYKLVLVDTRGHGMSDKPHDPQAYDSALNGEDVLAVLDELHIGKAHYWGFSMGGRIGFALAKYSPNRFNSFVFGGAQPYKSEPGFREQQAKGFQQGMEAYVAGLEKSTRLSRRYKATLLSNDAGALVALVSSDIWLAGFEDTLSTMAMPCLIYAGETDPFYEQAKRSASQIPNATFVSLPNLNHLQTFGRSDMVLPHVEKFLAAQS